MVAKATKVFKIAKTVKFANIGKITKTVQFA